MAINPRNSTCVFQTQLQHAEHQQQQKTNDMTVALPKIHSDSKKKWTYNFLQGAMTKVKFT